VRDEQFQHGQNRIMTRVRAWSRENGAKRNPVAGGNSAFQAFEIRVKATVGIELHFRPRLTHASSQQTLGSSVFPSVYRVNAAFKTILQYSSTIPPLSPHYSSTIILLELLLEVQEPKHRAENVKRNGSNFAKGSGKSLIS
jgi:hypothetical protein